MPFIAICALAKARCAMPFKILIRPLPTPRGAWLPFAIISIAGADTRRRGLHCRGSPPLSGSCLASGKSSSASSVATSACPSMAAINGASLERWVASRSTGNHFQGLAASREEFVPSSRGRTGRADPLRRRVGLRIRLIRIASKVISVSSGKGALECSCRSPGIPGDRKLGVDVADELGFHPLKPRLERRIAGFVPGRIGREFLLQRLDAFLVQRVVPAEAVLRIDCQTIFCSPAS